jgi:predicted lipoprotein
MIDKALLSLRPNAQWDLNGDDYSGLVWKDETQTKPTLKEINAEIARLQNEYNATEYQRLRSKEYPSIADQLDYIYHNGVDAWKTDMIDPVKNKYPKGVK